MRYIRLFLVVLAMLGSSFLYAQEYRTGLSRNVQLSDNDATKKRSEAKDDRGTIKIELPFFDNFKQQSVVPNPELWSDKQVFVNTGYQLYPPNRGVATFDAMNEYGYVYKHANDVSFFADSLTSNYIKMGKYKASDSLYLSFLYQPQGRGDRPEVQDSLIVEFQMREKDTIIKLRDSLTDDGQTIRIIDTIVKDKWFRVFSDRGYSIDEFKEKHGAYFKRVMIRFDHEIFTPYIAKLVNIAVVLYIDDYREQNNGASPPQNEIDELISSLTQELNLRYDTVFFHDDFRFRILNKASISPNALQSWQGNCDQWNVDNVYLNAERTYDDYNYYEEIGFIEPGRSFLKNYTAVPYRQYNNNPLAYLADSITTTIHNGFEYELMLKYEYEVYDNDGKFLYKYSAQKPTMPFSYATDPAIARPPFEYIFPVNEKQYPPFRIVQTVGYVSDKKKYSVYEDRIEYEQNMTNYFAYDDGTAELGYGLKGAGSMCAVRYELNVKDTLVGVRIYFNSTLLGANEKPFRIAVWRDNDLGKPGERIYLESGTSMPSYEGENVFVDFELDEPLEVRPTNLYVGWVQVYKENLNIGWDTSNPQRNNIFVYIPGEDEWRTTDYDDGCLMIRPLFKSEPNSWWGVDDMVEEQSFVVFPNPVVGSTLTVRGDVWKEGDAVEIYDGTGRCVYRIDDVESRLTGNDLVLNCGLRAGMYVVRVINVVNGGYVSMKILVK